MSKKRTNDAESLKSPSNPGEGASSPLRTDLDIPSESWAKLPLEKEVLQDRQVELKESTHVLETPELKNEQLPGRDPLSKAKLLESQLLPVATPTQLRELASAIRDAAKVPKPDREKFVLAINRLLAATGRSLEVDKDGVPQRVLELLVKNESIQYLPVSGDSIGLRHPAKLVKGR